MDFSTTKHKNYALRIALFSFIIMYAYAILRYVVFGETPWVHLPHYILNKALSFTALVLISLSFSVKPFSKLIYKLADDNSLLLKNLGLYGFIMALAHMILSFIAFNFDVYSKFFNDTADLTNAGGLSLLAGALAFYVLWKLKISHKPKSKIKDISNNNLIKKLSRIGILILLGLHLIFMGLGSWFSPEIWPAGMPPISLIAFIFVFIALILNVLYNKKAVC